ncbi:phosphodiesterase [Pseudoclavibacter endophyticus]|nr:phosphodiesterase [Pseudoclavibacter endophyticus]
MLMSPATGRPTLADVLPNCVAAMRGEVGMLGLAPVRAAVVMLVDGLGAGMLRSRAGHARRFMHGWGRKHTAHSFPSTTVAGVTSLTTATAAGVHGLCGYSLYDRPAGLVRNQLHGWGADMDPYTWQLQPTVFETLRDRGDLRPVAIGLSAYEASGLTRASLRGAEYIVGDTIADRVDRALDAVASDRSLVYLYVAELDQAGHKHGWESDAWIERLEETDAALATLEAGLPDDVGLLVTADHGMLDIPRERQRDIPADSELLEGVVAVAGEPRLRHLSLGDDATRADAERLAARWNSAEGDRATAITRRDALAAGWYGDPGHVHPAAAARLGDVIVAATRGVTYYAEWMQGGQRDVIGQHGSVSPEETIVPLIRKGAFTIE